VALAGFTLMPIYWIAATALKPESMIETWPPSWIPAPITFANFVTVFNELPIGRFFLNSAIIGISMILSNVVLCSLAGYTFARKEFPGRELLFMLIVGSMMVPPAGRLIPDYIITARLRIVLPMSRPAVTSLALFCAGLVR